LYRALPLSLAWNIECLASYPLMFAGMWLLLRRRGVGSAGALYGALLFTFCGFNLLHFVHVNAIAVVAHLPWLLFAIEGLRAAQQVRDRSGICNSLAIIAALTGSQLLLGYPQYVVYSLIAEILYLGFAVRERSPGKALLAASSGTWSLAKLLGLALAAVQVLPTLEALADSVRQTADESFSATGSLHPLNVVQLVAPYLFPTRVVGQNTHELGLYIGVVPLLLAVGAISNRCLRGLPRRAQSLRWLAIALILLGTLIALGSHGPVQRLLTELPLVGLLRFPCRALLLVHLGLVLLAGMGFCVLLGVFRRARTFDSQGNRAKLVSHRTLLFINFSSIALALAAPQLWPDHTAAGWLVWSGPVLVLLATLLILLAESGRFVALIGIVVWSAIDLGVYGLSYAAYRDVVRPNDYITQISLPTHANGERVALDLALPNREGVRAGNQVLLSGLSRIDGYAGLEPARSLDYRDVKALRLAGVRFVAAAAPIHDTSHLVEQGDGWREIADPLPRARLTSQYVCSETPRETLSAIDIDRVVVVQPEDKEAVAQHLNASPEEQGAPGSARMLIDRPGYLVVQTDSPLPAILALNESFHGGWIAHCDGSPLETLRLNGDFLGSLVNSGQSIIEFRFAPASLRQGRLISLFGLGFLVMLIAAGRLPRLRNPQGS
jgi:hypothetical protein